MRAITRLTETLGAWAMVGVLSILPLFFLPLTQDFYDTPKWFLLVALALVVSLIWTVRSLATQTVTVSRSPATIGMLAIALASLLSLAFSSTNRIEALLIPFGTGTWVSLALLLLLGETFLSALHRSSLQSLLVASASLLGVIAVYQVIGLGKVMVPALAFLSDPSWTPAGSTIGVVSVLVLSFPLAIDRALRSVRNQKDVAIALFVVAILTIAGGLTASVWQLLPTLPNLLPHSYGWAIMLEALKTWKHFLVGVGAENFLYAFTHGRSVGLNNTSLWNVRFTANSNILFHIVTIYGLGGFVGMMFLIRSLLIPFRVSALAISKLLAVLILFVVQPQFISLIAIAILLLETPGADTRHVHRPRWKLLMNVVGFVLAMGAFAALYGVGRAFASELIFMRSLASRAAGDGKATYTLQVQALMLNPWSSRYRIAYSQTNLDIANAIARATDQKSLTDTDRQTMTTLIQQAIREAKIAVNDNQTNPLAWENLTRIYQNLTRVAQGADKWTIASYQQTIALDPTNPLLRVSYANFLEAQNDTDGATSEYQTAVSLKSDLATAQYGLARTYRQRGQYQLEAQALVKTLTMLSAGSNDEVQVRSELEIAKSHLTDTERAQLPTEASPGALLQR